MASDVDIKAKLETDIAPKPGYKSTELYVTIVLAIVGLYLLSTGEKQLGTALLAAAGVSYSGSRGLAKLNLAGLLK